MIGIGGRLTERHVVDQAIAHAKTAASIFLGHDYHRINHGDVDLVIMLPLRISVTCPGLGFFLQTRGMVGLALACAS